MPLDVKSFPILPNFFWRELLQSAPTREIFFWSIRNFFWWDRFDRIVYKKLFFITRCGRLLVRSLFKRWCLRKIFFSESIFYQQPIDCNTESFWHFVSTLQGAKSTRVLRTVKPIMIKSFNRAWLLSNYFCWYRSLKGSGQNFYRHLVFVFHFHHSFQNLS